MVGRNNNTHRTGVAQTNGYRFLMNTSEINAEIILVFRYVPKKVRPQACKVKFRVMFEQDIKRA